MIDGIEYYWRIDCHNLEMSAESEDLTDPKVTRRWLTVGVLKEYR